MESKSLSDYLGEGVYLRFDGTNIKNERNFENGCADMTIPPKDLTVCVLQSKRDYSIVFSRFEIIKYMMGDCAAGADSMIPEHISLLFMDSVVLSKSLYKPEF